MLQPLDDNLLILRILQGEERIKERIPAGRAWYMKTFHQIFEQIILVFKSPECDFLHFFQVLKVRLGTLRMAANGKRVDKHTYDWLHFFLRSSGNRRSHDQIFLTRIFMHKDRVSRQQHHVQGRARPCGQFFQLFRPFFPNIKLHGPAVKTLHRRPREVRRQFQYRQLARQLFQPVLLLRLDQLPVGFGMLPNGIIFVLNTQRSQAPHHDTGG